MDMRGAKGVQSGAGSQQYNYFASTRTVSWPLRIGVVPALATAFQLRAALRQEIQLARRHSTVVLTQVLTGGGGVGKSQLAAFYATQVLADQVDLVLWVPAKDIEQVISSYAHAAHLVQAPGLSSQDTESHPSPFSEDAESDSGAFNQAAESDARAFLDWLATTTRTWLIILDDISDPQALSPWWPNAGPGINGQVLATTRRRDALLSGGGRVVVEVDTYTDTEALTYLETRLTNAGSSHLLDGQADAVVQALGQLPLALSHAAAHMINEDLPCARYLELFAEHFRIQDLLPHETDTEGYGRHAATTLLMGLEAAQQCEPRGVAVPAMRLASHLDPAGHPQSLWTTEAITTHLTHHRASVGEGVDSEVDARQAQAALRLLHRYSLLTCKPHSGARAVRLHALTARAARESTPPAEVPGIAQAAADALCTIWPEEDHVDRELCATLRANTETLALSAGKHLWRDDPSVIYRSGESLFSAGLYFEAVRHWQHTALNSELYTGPIHRDTLKALEMLARSYQQAGRADDAVTILERVTDDRECVLGPNHPDTQRARNNLAGYYFQAGRINLAVTVLERVVADRERLLGFNHADTLRAQNNLAVSYQRAGRINVSIALHERIATDTEHLLGPNHPDSIRSWHNLAVCYQKADRTDEATTLLERVTNDRERVLGPNDPGTLRARNNLAFSYQRAGRIDLAIFLHERVATDTERLLGFSHPDTLVTWADLGVAYRQAGRVEEAITLHERVAADRERLLGPKHPDTLRARHNLAVSYQEAGRTSEAIIIQECVATDRDRVLGPDHPDTLVTLAGLAFSYRQAGRTDKATTLLGRVADDFERNLGRHHPDTHASREKLREWRAVPREAQSRE